MSFLVMVTDPDLRAVTNPLPWTSLDCVLRHNAVSSGVMVCPATRELLTAASVENARVLVVQPAGVGGYPPGVLISGPIERPGDYRWSVEPDQDAGPGMVTVGFADNLAYLAERVAYPDPASPADDQSTGVYVADGVNAETAMRALVNLNAGPGALAGRRVPHLALGAVAGVGTAVDVAARFDPLLDVLRYAALLGGDLTFRVRETGGQLLFEVHGPTTQHNARFGRSRNNLRSLSTTPHAPSATVAIVGGAGDGAARLIVERSAAGGWRRMETFVNQSADTTTALDAYGDEALAEKAEKVGLSAVAVDAGRVRFGVDYFLGDLVPVELATGLTRVDRVTQVQVQATPESGVLFTPTIGSPDPTTNAAVLQVVREMARRLGRLERR